MSATMSDHPTRARTVPVITGTVLLACAGTVVSALARRPVTATEVALVVAIGVFAFTGAVLTLARPDNRTGWLLLAGAGAWGVGEGLYDAAVHGIVAAPGSVPAAGALAVIGAPLRGLGWLVIALAVPAVFPDGHLPGPRWRWLGWLVVAAAIAGTVGQALSSDVESDELHAAGWHSPLPVPAVVARFGDLLSVVSLPLLAVGLGGVVAAMVTRSRRDPALRRQLLLFALAVALPVIVVPTTFLTDLPSWVFVVSVVPIPVATAVAIFTGGVFDLATVANRSLVWTALTAVVVGIYALVVAGTGALLRNAHSPFVPWLAVAAVAVSFAPLRSGLQSAINRLTYGRWRQPYEVLALLGQRIDAAADADRLAGEVVTELRTSLGLRAVALLDPAGQLVTGEPGGETLLPLIAYGRAVGALRFTEPATALRPDDRRLLDNLAAQLSSLLYSRGLTADLSRARERLVRAREEERRRLRRDLHDDLGPTLAGMMLKVDTALARMQPDPQAAQQDLIVLRADIQGTVGNVRRLVEGLRPPAIDELGLTTAVEQAVRRLAIGAGLDLDVTLDLDGTLAAAGPLPAAIEVAVYRIVSEAVTNVVRHAGAGRCTVVVRLDGDHLLVQVGDDGRGLAGRSGAGHGLETMRERAEELGGRLSVVDGDGTVVTATLPLAGHLRDGVGA